MAEFKAPPAAEAAGPAAAARLLLREPFRCERGVQCPACGDGRGEGGPEKAAATVRVGGCRAGGGAGFAGRGGSSDSPQGTAAE